ncbi:MAG: aldose 1-epimerase [Isosphaeraceae bacterium]
MAYRITTEPRGTRTIYHLHDDTSGASAAVLPSYGFNLFDLRLPVGGAVRPVLDAFHDFADNPRSPGRNGIPILFPFPNRIAQGRFGFEGKTYSLPANNGPNAIHGFAIAAPWEVVGQSTEGSASLTGRYQISVNSPDMVAHWPTDGVLEVRYDLVGRRLTMTVTISNPTAHDLPYGFGIHPYFRCPFTPGADQSRTRVTIPAERFWKLDSFIPTGERPAVDERLDFRGGQPMKGLKLDDVLTGLSFDADGRCVCRLEDLELKAEFRLIVDRNTRELVVYIPPGDGGILAIEPYTQTTDAINLAARGVDGGLRVLGHGKTDRLVIVMETSG